MDDMFSILAVQPFVAAVLVDSLSGPKIDVEALQAELREARFVHVFVLSGYGAYVCISLLFI